MQLAGRFEGEVVNCDSVQIYRFFNIGAAKLPEQDRRGIPHHLIDIANPDEVFTAGDFARVGRPVLHEIAGRGRLPVVTGGTGFYLRALLDGLAPGPQRDEALRARLRERETRRPGSIHRLLRRFDPPTAARIHPNDMPKVMRALEICISAQKDGHRSFRRRAATLCRVFAYSRSACSPIANSSTSGWNRAWKRMFAAGLIEETASILARGICARTRKPFESIGYKQALQTIQGELSPKDALFYATRDTRRYAKRQMTWFRQEPGMEIFSGFGDDPAIVDRSGAGRGMLDPGADRAESQARLTNFPGLDGLISPPHFIAALLT